MKARYAMLAIAAALMTLATPANAVDLHGYFRAAIGGSSAGGDQVTFKNAGQDYKLRLGNEDNWSEFEFVQPLLKDKNGVEWTMGFMLGWGNGFTGDQDFSGPTALQQEYLRATFPQLGGATVWGGKRFYHRQANDIIDYFYMNESNAGAGIEDIDVGFGKFAAAIFRISPKAGSNVVYWMPDVRLEGIPVNPGGTLMIAVLAKMRSWNKNKLGDKATVAPNTQDFSPFIMVKHSQSGILNGGNNLAVTYKTGCFVNVNGNIKDITGADPAIPDCQEDLRMLTVSEDLTLNPTKEFSVILSGMYQNVGMPDLGSGKKVTLNSYFVGARPLFKVADHFALQGDVGYFYNKSNQSGDKERTMVLATFAPTITPFTDGFYSAHSAPEIRFYVTYASWNKEQRATTGNTFGLAGKDVTNGLTFGSQVEAWF
jgi:maltoporin